MSTKVLLQGKLLSSLSLVAMLLYFSAIAAEPASAQAVVAPTLPSSTMSQKEADRLLEFYVEVHSVKLSAADVAKALESASAGDHYKRAIDKVLKDSDLDLAKEIIAKSEQQPLKEKIISQLLSSGQTEIIKKMITDAIGDKDSKMQFTIQQILNRALKEDASVETLNLLDLLLVSEIIDINKNLPGEELRLLEKALQQENSPLVTQLLNRGADFRTNKEGVALAAHTDLGLLWTDPNLGMQKIFESEKSSSVPMVLLKNISQPNSFLLLLKLIQANKINSCSPTGMVPNLKTFSDAIIEQLNSISATSTPPNALKQKRLKEINEWTQNMQAYHNACFAEEYQAALNKAPAHSQ